MSENTGLEINHLDIKLTTGINSRLLVNNVSFGLAAGEALGIVGESGSGKSMLCLAVCGLLPTGIHIENGSILFDGSRLDNLDAEAYRKIRAKKISVVLQNPMSCFNPLNTIEQHFRETLFSHNIPYNRINTGKILESLRAAGFDNPPEIIKKYPFQLSGGMLQCIMISLGIFFDSPLIIADEPTTDLDPLTQQKILTLLDTVRKKMNSSLIFVSHDLAAVSRITNRIIILKEGEICEQGLFTDLYEDAEHAYTKALFNAYRKLNADFNVLGN